MKKIKVEGGVVAKPTKEVKRYAGATEEQKERVWEKVKATLFEDEKGEDEEEG